MEHEKVQLPPQLQTGISGLSDQKALWPFSELQVYMLSIFISAFTGSMDARYLTKRWQFIHLKQENLTGPDDFKICNVNKSKTENK